MSDLRPDPLLIAGHGVGENRNPSDPDDLIGLYAQVDASQLDAAVQATVKTAYTRA